MNKITHKINDSEIQKIRIDKYIADNLKLFSRSQIKHRSVTVYVNNEQAKLSKYISYGDNLEITYEDLKEPDYGPEKIDLDIIYEDKNTIILNKKQGVVVHPAAGNYTGTLVQGLLYYSNELKEKFKEEKIRPGIVHRLDKDTSGIIIAAKNPDTQEYLSKQFRNKTTKKVYLAIVKGNLRNKKGIISTYITRNPFNRKKYTWSETKGKKSVTYYKLLKNYKDYAFVALRPQTGRTHQLRVHMLSIGHPVLGDTVYSRKDNLFPATLMLHAYKLCICCPDNKPEVFRAPLPDRFKQIIIKLAKIQKE